MSVISLNESEHSIARRFGAICALFFGCLLLLTGCSGEPTDGEQEGPGAKSACGTAVPGFDSDGDGVSDAIEAANAELFGAGRCDEDPSKPQGEYHAGSLAGAVNLPDSAAGYRHWLGTDPKDADDWADLTLVQCVEAVGLELAGVGVTMHVGDLSKRAGGAFFPHKTHQNGLEVDVHYPRKDGAAAPINIWSDQQRYDAAAARDLFGIFGRSCDVSVIFAAVDLMGFSPDDPGLPSIVDHPQRRSDFLVRLRRPTKKRP